MAGFRFIVGLGNPGSQYKGTRHNIGFEVVEELVRLFGTGSWKVHTASGSDGSETAEILINTQKFLLIKPMTYMNRSGQPLSRIARFYASPGEKIADSTVVIHDEIDIPSGTLRLKVGGGEGGHNGLRSISTELASKEYARVRVGVGKPPNPAWEISDWVLSRFAKEEQPVIEGAVRRACDAVKVLVTDGLKAAQNLYND